MSHFVQEAFSHPVSETLLIPLWIRAAETGRSDKIIDDPDAVHMVEKLKYDYQTDFSGVEGKQASQLGIAIRAGHFDQAVRQVLDQWDYPVIVNVGCGLDSRFKRTDTGKGIQVELDLPPVMQLRQHFLPPSERNPHISASAKEEAWMDELLERYPNGRFAFVFEGVLLYFTEDEVQQLIRRLADRFPRGKLYFDACSSWMSKHSNRLHDVLKQSRAQFRLGLDDPFEICRWEPRMVLESVDYYLDKYPRRWGWRNIYRFIPPLARTFKMLAYDIRS